MELATGVPRVGVACIVTREGRTLLVRRQRSHGAGSWSTPGGHLDFGESPVACAIRETEEETGVRVAHPGFVAITNDVFADDGKHYITIWMHAEAGDTEAVIRDPSEIADVGWFAFDDLPSPLFLSFENLLAGRHLPADARIPRVDG